MKVLSIDTSSKIASIAIIEDGRVLDEMHVLSEEEHSQTLMPMIEKMFNDNNMDLDEIDLIGCSRGPGSFTGIRIGIATAKAFSDAKNIPLIGIDSLEALAYSVVIEKENNDCEILAMINAKNDNVYAATYLVNNGKLNMVKNAEIMNLTETVNYIDFKKQVFIVGCEDEDSIRKLIQAEASSERAISGDDCSFEFVKDTIPTAASIGIAAYEKYKNGVVDEIIVPLYLRKPQAERNLFQVDEKTIVTEMAITDKEFIIDNYDKFSSSIESAKLKGYSDEDIMKLLNELPKKPEPQPEEPIGDDYVNDTILNITYEDVKKVEKAKRVTFSKATSIDIFAFNNFKFEKVNLPNLSNITDDYCFSSSSIKELSIPSLVWNGTDHPDITTLNSIEVLVVSENSNINGWVFNKFSDLIIYSPDKTKKWDKATSAWKPV